MSLHRTHHRPTATARALGALLLAATVAAPAAAQNAAPAAPLQSQLVIVHVKPDMGREWTDYLKNESNPAAIKSGVKSRQVWSTAAFGEGGEYALVTPITDMADFDEPTPMMKALGQEGMAALGAKRNRLINGTQTMMINPRPALGFAPPAGYQAKLGVSVRNIVADGHMADFISREKAIHAVIAKTNARGVVVSQVGLGGNPNEFITLVLFDSFADIGKFAALYGKAAAEAKLGQGMPGTVSNSEWRVFRYRPELSIVPAP